MLCSAGLASEVYTLQALEHYWNVQHHVHIASCHVRQREAHLRSLSTLIVGRAGVWGEIILRQF
jgi:hypothetical protein